MQVIPKIPNWHQVMRPPTLSPGGLHLWKIRTGADGTPLAGLWPLLSPQESARAGRLRFDHHRERYVRTHAGLRLILSTYINLNPQDIVFKVLCAGKPFLESTDFRLDFNLTTSGDLALVGLSADAPIGVDCEQVRGRADVIAIAKRMFSPEEAFRIAVAPEEERLDRFHIAWTALEAEVKADGRGLAGRKQPTAQERLEIKHCIPVPGFIAAVARKGLPPVENWVTLELPRG